MNQISTPFVEQQQFLIKRGVVQEKTQEFIIFKRANITKWGQI
jgi:hypothetical protein